jgi:hypothetical protein
MMLRRANAAKMAGLLHQRRAPQGRAAPAADAEVAANIVHAAVANRVGEASSQPRTSAII